eukprot:7215186-Prymnesium_polylepis.1
MATGPRRREKYFVKREREQRCGDRLYALHTEIRLLPISDRSLLTRKSAFWHIMTYRQSEAFLCVPFLSVSLRHSFPHRFPPLSVF